MNITYAVALTVGFTVLIWLSEAIDYILPLDMDAWGVHGLAFDGFFPGFVLMPVLHAGFGHLISNTVPIMVLGFLAAVKGLRQFFIATMIILVVCGVGVWATSLGAVTIGASGMIFGYFGYLVARGVFHRSLTDILIAVGVIVFYGSIIWGIFPTDSAVSWQAHLFGFIGGVIAAWVLRRKRVTGTSAA